MKNELHMERRHFEAIAATIAAMDDIVIRNSCAVAFGKMCAKSNERFNLAKFYEACNIQFKVRS